MFAFFQKNTNFAVKSTRISPEFGKNKGDMLFLYGHFKKIGRRVPGWDHKAVRNHYGSGTKNRSQRSGCIQSNRIRQGQDKGLYNQRPEQPPVHRQALTK